MDDPLKLGIYILLLLPGFIWVQTFEHHLLREKKEQFVKTLEIILFSALIWIVAYALPFWWPYNGIGIMSVVIYTHCMVTKVYVCPHCQGSEGVVRFGFTDGARQRLRCKACRRTWTLDGPGRHLSAEKEALIEKALQERVSQRAIARTLSCGRATIRRVLKKSPRPAA